MEQEYLINYVINNMSKDKDLIDFYNMYYYNYSEISFDEYIRELFIDNPILLQDEYNEARKKILRIYINTRTRLKKTGTVNERLITFSNVETAKKSTIKSICDNECKMKIIDIIIDFKENLSTITERPLSLDGMYSTKEKQTFFNTENTVEINNKKAFLSDEQYKRHSGTVQPLYIQGDSSVEAVIVKKGETAYLKSKSIDVKDQKIMDFLIEEYKKVMYYSDQELVYPLYKISELIYKHKSTNYLNLTMDRLVKMSRQGYIVFKDKLINNNEMSSSLVNTDDANNFEIVNLFEIGFFTNENNVRYCRILMSRSIEKDLKNSNTIKLYKHKIDQIKNDFTAIFVNYVQSARIFSLLKNEKEYTIPYNIIKINMMLPFSRSKVKNLEAIRLALQEIKDMNFLIHNFEVKNTYIKLYFIDFSYIELKQLKLESQIKELEV